MEKLSTGVFKRHGIDSMSERSFFLLLGVVLVWGLGGTALVADKVAQSNFQLNWITIIFCGLVIPIVGIFVAIKSDNPVLSFVGYNMVIIPFGIILSPIVNKYSADLIRNAFLLTAAVTGIMMTLAVVYPKFFEKIGGTLFIALLSLLGVRILQIFIPGIDFSIFDWIGAAIFSLYIGYDWHRAMNVPKTADNAVDIALDLYLDIINLFLHILRIMGKKN